MHAKLYWFPLAHPSHAVRTMLELKGMDYELVHVLPGNQRLHLRVAGFRHGSVPALKLDGRRIQGSTNIARELDAVSAQPLLFPADPADRKRVEEAERSGDAEFQSVPRRILRWGLTKDAGLRRRLAEQDGKIDELVAERVIGRDRPNAATLQIMCTVRSLLGFSDFEDQVGARSFAPLARELFPHFPADKVPAFVERLGPV